MGGTIINKETNTTILDEKDSRGVHCMYKIVSKNNGTVFANIHFQEDSIGSDNGCFEEDLLNIVAYRLECLMLGGGFTTEVKEALDKVEDALALLRYGEKSLDANKEN